MPKSLIENKSPVVCTHDNVFHADEVLAIAIVRLINPNVTIIRTRNEDVLQSADFRIDIGGKYDPETGDFDHHQEGFDIRHISPNQNKYEQGPKRSGAGLIWLNYGKEAIESFLKTQTFPNPDVEIDKDSIDFVHTQIDKNLIAPIDAFDNGEGRDFYLDTGAYRVPSIGRIVQNLNPSWLEKSITDGDTYFYEALDLTVNCLKREIVKNFAVFAGRFVLLEKIKEVDSSGLLILEEFVPWSPIFSQHQEETKHVKMVIFPAVDSWMVQSPYFMKIDYNDFSFNMPDGTKRKQRYPAPSHICGKTNEDLAKLTDVEDAVFIHATGFIGAARTKEGAIKLAQYIIDNQDK